MAILRTGSEQIDVTYPPRTKRAGLRAALAAVAVVSVTSAGCSMVKLGYDWLPTLALWRADGYLALNADQKGVAQRHLVALQDWHRNTQIDDYIGFLRNVRQRVAEGPVDAADIRRWRESAIQRWRPIAVRMAPAAAEVAGTLEVGQLERMKAEFARDNAKMRREWLPADRTERLEARTKRYVDRAETMLGPLTDAQKQLARAMAAEAPPTEQEWYAQRQQRQQELLAVMDRIRTERPPEPVAAGWMREHLVRYGQPRPGAGPVGTDSSLSLGDSISAALLAQATPRQRQHLDRKLQEWIELLQSIKPAQTARVVEQVSTALLLP
jgi:hypothetical protein